jgi:hypothetical protein
VLGQDRLRQEVAAMGAATEALGTFDPAAILRSGQLSDRLAACLTTAMGIRPGSLC